MSTGKGIAIPTPKKPIQAVGTTVFTREADGIHRYMGTPTGIELFKREIRSEVGADPEPQPEPETRARRQISATTKAKMAAAQKKRQAELRKAQEGVSETTSSTPAKRKPKTMAANSSA